MVKQNEDGISMKIWQALTVGVVVGFLGGVGAMQATIVGDVRDNKVNVAHMAEECHGMFVPINPKPGMVYETLPKMAYKKGDDPREWYDSIVAAGGRMPKWELKV